MNRAMIFAPISKYASTSGKNQTLCQSIGNLCFVGGCDISIHNANRIQSSQVFISLRFILISFYWLIFSYSRNVYISAAYFFLM